MLTVLLTECKGDASGRNAICKTVMALVNLNHHFLTVFQRDVREKVPPLWTIQRELRRQIILQKAVDIFWSLNEALWQFDESLLQGLL